MTEWILPSNIKQYRTDDALRALGVIEWFQSKMIKNIERGDIVYIYISTPFQELHWKCLVTDVNRIISKIDDKEYYPKGSDFPPSENGPFIELTAIYEYELKDMVSYKQLKEHGLKSRMMGPCRVSAELSSYLRSVELIQQSKEKQEEHLRGIDLSTLAEHAKKSFGGARKTTAVTTSYHRDPYVSQYAKRRANGICQLCGKTAPFLDGYEQPYLETHHIKWLSQGGEDSIENTAALCPNCHRKMHVINDPLDVEKLLNKVKG